MPNTTNGIGLFTADNIVAVLTVIPQTNGTYEQIAQAAAQMGACVTHPTVANWVTKGKADIRQKKNHTAYARFAQRFAKLIAENCGTDHNRNRELDRALQILEQSCECGQPKHVFPDGSVANACRSCLDLRRQKSRRGQKGNCPRCKGNLFTTEDGPRCLQCGRYLIADIEGMAA